MNINLSCLQFSFSIIIIIMGNTKKISKNKRNTKKSSVKEELPIKLTTKELKLLEEEYQRYELYHLVLNKMYISLECINDTRTSYEVKNALDRLIINFVNQHHNLKHLFYADLTLTKYQSHEEFRKMISELRDKKILVKNMGISKITEELAKILYVADKKYQERKTKPKINKSLIHMKDHDDFVEIQYKKYNRFISKSRYHKMRTNFTQLSDYQFLKIILRYSLFTDSGQQWSYGDDKLYEMCSDIFNINMEMFGSPLNFLMYRYCSMFLDTDAPTGSYGSAYNILNNEEFLKTSTGCFYCPPYVEGLMDDTAKIVNNILEKFEKDKRDYSILCFLPNWEDAGFFKTLMKSKYQVASKKLIKGEYICQKKSLGKKGIVAFPSRTILLNSIAYTNEEREKELKQEFSLVLKYIEGQGAEYKRKGQYLYS